MPYQPGISDEQDNQLWYPASQVLEYVGIRSSSNDEIVLQIASNYDRLTEVFSPSGFTAFEQWYVDTMGDRLKRMYPSQRDRR